MDPAFTDASLLKKPETSTVKPARGFQSDALKVGPSETLAVASHNQHAFDEADADFKR